MNVNPTNSTNRGFCAIEMIAVAAILGILATIALSVFGGAGGKQNIVSAQRKAHNIAMVFNSGRASGAFSSNDEQTGSRQPILSVPEAMDAVGRGSNGSGSMAHTRFQLAGVSSGMDAGKPAEERASSYLSWSDGLLKFEARGRAAAGAPGSPAFAAREAAEAPSEFRGEGKLGRK